MLLACCRVVISATLFGYLASIVTAADVQFTRDVRSILSKHCFKCHGPDEATRESGLRLDLREAAIAPADSGAAALVPAKPDESELIRRILSTDTAEMMPPPEANLPLTDEQKKVLRDWIAAGAEYQQHWAFVKPQRPGLPSVKQTAWPTNAVDHFVLSRLEQEGLSPAAEADRHTLIRRVYLDLIGVPPTPEEADAFAADTSPDAYEKVIDRLLASPHYGERWARPWLDLARYADTNGYEKDRVRSIWPYRDWVINALNADMPFDQFTIEQLAGDMLPNTTIDQRIATGFHRNTMINEEGGIDPLEFRFHAMTDRVATTATVWLGLTLGCAQCHTHKYDPIPHSEYYAFMALLDNADEPEIDIPRPEITAKREEILAQIAAAEVELANQFPLEEAKADAAQNAPAAAGGTETEAVRRKQYLDRKFDEWVKAEATRVVSWTPIAPAKATSNLPKLEVLPDASVLSSGDQTKRDVYELELSSPLKNITAIRLEALPDDRLPKHGPGRVYYEGPHGDFFLSELKVSAGGAPIKFSAASHTFADGKHAADKAIDGDPLTGWAINGGQGKAHTAVFKLAEPLADASALKLDMIFERYYAAGMGRFRVSVTDDPKAGEPSKAPAGVAELLGKPADTWSAENRDMVLRYYLSVAPELAKAREAIDKLRAGLPAYPTTLVMTERPVDYPRSTYRRHRGEFLQPAEKVEPNVLSMLPPLPAEAPRNRLALARWLVDPQNPLVARVTMNRHWAYLFGRGLVRTTADFGFQGESPSHPELLDYLASEFIQQGWSMKKMHRLIVTSAAYKQSSHITPTMLEKDSENILLARGPRRRLEAELIRDAALKASGLLSEKLGGPSVFPPQPASVTSEGAYGKLEWKVSEGEDRYRRGLYTFAKRTAPFAMFTTFDAPSGEACTPRRDVSNTPLQALTLLNDTVFVEAARAMGRIAADASMSPQDGARLLFRRALVREPNSDELKLLTDFYTAQKGRFERGDLNAEKVAGTAEGELVERASWTTVARALLNVDEFIVNK